MAGAVVGSAAAQVGRKSNADPAGLIAVTNASTLLVLEARKGD